MVYPYETLYDIDLVEGQRVKFTIKFLPNCGDKNILKAQNVGEEHAPYFWDIRINGTSIFTPTFTPEPTKTIDPTAPTATSTPTFDPTAPTPTPLPTINHSYVFDYIVPAYNPLNPTNIFVKAQFYTSDKQDKQKILDISKDVFPKVKNIPYNRRVINDTSQFDAHIWTAVKNTFGNDPQLKYIAQLVKAIIAWECRTGDPTGPSAKATFTVDWNVKNLMRVQETPTITDQYISIYKGVGYLKGKINFFKNNTYVDLENLQKEGYEHYDGRFYLEKPPNPDYVDCPPTPTRVPTICTTPELGICVEWGPTPTPVCYVVTWLCGPDPNDTICATPGITQCYPSGPASCIRTAVPSPTCCTSPDMSPTCTQCNTPVPTPTAPFYYSVPLFFYSTSDFWKFVVAAYNGGEGGIIEHMTYMLWKRDSVDPAERYKDCYGNDYPNNPNIPEWKWEEERRAMEIFQKEKNLPIDKKETYWYVDKKGIKHQQPWFKNISAAFENINYVANVLGDREWVPAIPTPPCDAGTKRDGIAQEYGFDINYIGP